MPARAPRCDAVTVRLVARFEVDLMRVASSGCRLSDAHVH